MPLTIRQAETSEDRERVFRIRYDIYVKEMQRPQTYADRVKRTIKDHEKLVKHLIMDCVTRYPESEAAMLRCFDYFRQVYPLPVWTEAYHRALASA